MDVDPSLKLRSDELLCSHERYLNDKYLKDNELMFTNKMKCGSKANMFLRLDSLYFDTMIPVADPKQFCKESLIRFRAGNAHIVAPLENYHWEFPLNVNTKPRTEVSSALHETCDIANAAMFIN